MRINPQALRAIRERSGHTVSSLAREAEVNRSHLANIEAGRRNPSPKVAKALADTLVVEITAILADPDDEDTLAELVTLPVSRRIEQVAS